MNVAIIFAGGSGKRMLPTGRPKQFLELYGKPIIVFTLEIFQHHKEIDKIVIPCISGWEEYLQELVDKYELTKVVKILKGGKDSQESKLNALNYLNTVCDDDDIVILHDAVRPIISEKLITENIKSVKEYGSAISYVPFNETGIVSGDRSTISETILRNTLFIARAPQSFYFKDVYEAHLKGVSMRPEITIDTCSLMVDLGMTLHLVECESSNIKITTPDDFFIFKALVDLKESKEIFGL